MHGQWVQERLAIAVLQRQLQRCRSRKGANARQHFLVHDGQAVLVAVAANPPIERFGRRVERCHPARGRRRAAAEIFH